MNQKLGLQTNAETDAKLIYDLLDLLADAKLDYTIFFRSLSKVLQQINSLDTMFTISPSHLERWRDWLSRYKVRLTHDGDLSDMDRVKNMNNVNPKYILRNYMAQIAIEKAQKGDYVVLNSILRLLRNPFDEQYEFETYAGPPPDWAKTYSC